MFLFLRAKWITICPIHFVRFSFFSTNFNHWSCGRSNISMGMRKNKGTVLTSISVYYISIDLIEININSYLDLFFFFFQNRISIIHIICSTEKYIITVDLKYRSIIILNGLTKYGYNTHAARVRVYSWTRNRYFSIVPTLYELKIYW